MFKKDTIKPPDFYLGTNVQRLDTGRKECWGLSSDKYVKEAISNVQKKLKEDDFQFHKKLSSPGNAEQLFSSLQYRPELDTSTFCNEEQSTLFMNLIGVLRWIIELGRIDIAYEVSCLSRYLASPHTGHLLQAIHIFKYLDKHHENILAFDPTKISVPNPAHDSVDDRVAKMRRVYQDAKEYLPHNAPEPLGESM